MALHALSRRSFLLTATAALAQNDTTFKASVKVVSVLVSVHNKDGEVVRDLSKDDFTLLEDGRPQQLRYFSRDTDLPLTLGLLIDTSASQRRILAEERTASFRFLNQVMRPEKDLAFVIHFDTEVELLQDLTSVKKDLEAALKALNVSQGRFAQRRTRGPRAGGPGIGTALYDSVMLASDELMKKQQGRKALILLTDGVDAGSKVSLDTAIETAQRADTLVYSVLFYDEEAYGTRRSRRGRQPAIRRPDGRKTLERISRETGGGFFQVSKKLSLEQIFHQIDEELRTQYNLGYVPDKIEPGYHKLECKVKGRGLTVRARQGYYAE